MRLLRQPLACSWRSLSTCNTTTVVALSLHKRARRTSSSFRLSLLVFSFSLCVSVWRRFSSLPALCFRLCRHSASRLCWRSALSGLVSGLVSGLCFPLCRRFAPQFSSLFRFCLISASATPLARRVALYSTVSLVKTTVFS